MKNGKKDLIGQIYVDPVCWKKVLPAEDHLTVSYRMRTYFFCSDSCRKAFLSKPETYLEPGSCFEKSGWRLCLKRVKASVTGLYPRGLFDPLGLG